MIKLKVLPGQEVLAALTAQLAERNIREAAIVSLIGAADEFCISNMAKADAMKDILTEYTEPCELSGTGAVSDGKVHIHVVLGREDNSTLSGHLHWANVKSYFVEAYVMPLD
ncbi:PPC domain-containing DNA-binding protein [Nonomuraea sp. NPDC048882]|uniref:PPC domain-containing DNA-binding protein n=1 Tax=Nonomuraea sp. NPDC048882 TaxID=3154347 RepID=UPI0033FC20D6